MGGLPSEFSVVQSAFGRGAFYEDKKKEKEREGVAEGSCRGKKSAARQIRMICLKSYEKAERPRLPERQFRGRSVFLLSALAKRK